MWAIVCLLLIAVTLVIRYVVVQTLSTVRSREPRTLTAVRRVLKLMCADPNRAKVVLTRDRSALVPGASRRRARKF